MAKQTVSIPDIGSPDGAEVIEIMVAVGDQVEEGQDILTLETDKASMDLPASSAGKISAIKVAVGDKVLEGDVVLELELGDASESADTDPEPAKAEPEPAPEASISEPSSATSELVVPVPEGGEDADVVEVFVAVGDEVAEGESLVVLETDKASMEVPSPKSGKVTSLEVKLGDKTSEGGTLLVLAVSADNASNSSAASTEKTHSEPAKSEAAKPPETKAESAPPQASSQAKATVSDADVILASQSKDVYAGPAVRKLAREMGVDLTQVTGTGERSRISKDDVKTYVKQVMTGSKPAPQASNAGVGGAGIPPIPAVDFSQFGEVEMLPMSKIKKITAANMSRNWLNVPHVTQFDDADITDLETFRKGLKAEAEKRGVKLTPLPFLLKACAAALVAEPSFNVSLHHDGEHIVQKKYVNIGVAVDSPVGLVVPVIKDVDKKGLWQLSEEFMAIIDKARNGKLTPKDMQGGCFTVSSLGAIGGQGFTPLVNAPEVAILGVSRAEIKPKWNGSEFIPRNMMPLCLSYDHRAINGGDAGRFMTYLTNVIGDVRKLLL